MAPIYPFVPLKIRDEFKRILGTMAGSSYFTQMATVYDDWRTPPKNELPTPHFETFPSICFEVVSDAPQPTTGHDRFESTILFRFQFIARHGGMGATKQDAAYKFVSDLKALLHGQEPTAQSNLAAYCTLIRIHKPVFETIVTNDSFISDFAVVIGTVAFQYRHNNTLP